MRITLDQLKQLQAAEPALARHRKHPERARRDLEHELQSLCVQWWDIHPVLKRHHFIAIPNQAERSPASHARMAAEGFRKGAFDTFFVTPSGRIAYVEFKSPTGELSDEQEAFQAWCDRLGIPNTVCRSFREFEAFVGRFFEIKRNNA